MRLEIERARSKLAPAEVEQGAAASAGAPHHFPVHEVVRRNVAGILDATGVVGKHFVAEEEAHDAADRTPAECDGQHLAVITKLSMEGGEVALGKDRCPEIPDALRIDRVQPIDVAVDLAHQSVLL